MINLKKIFTIKYLLIFILIILLIYCAFNKFNIIENNGKKHTKNFRNLQKANINAKKNIKIKTLDES